jgi:hypothetical protein
MSKRKRCPTDCDDIVCKKLNSTTVIERSYRDLCVENILLEINITNVLAAEIVDYFKEGHYFLLVEEEDNLHAYFVPLNNATEYWLVTLEKNRCLVDIGSPERNLFLPFGKKKKNPALWDKYKMDPKSSFIVQEVYVVKTLSVYLEQH